MLICLSLILMQSYTIEIIIIGARTFEARLLCVCSRCLAFFSAAWTLCLCSNTSRNPSHTAYLGHIQVYTSSANCPQLTHVSKYTPMYTYARTHAPEHTCGILIRTWVVYYYTSSRIHAQNRCLSALLYTSAHSLMHSLCDTLTHSHAQRERCTLAHKGW